MVGEPRPQHVGPRLRAVEQPIHGQHLHLQGEKPHLHPEGKSQGPKQDQVAVKRNFRCVHSYVVIVHKYLINQNEDYRDNDSGHLTEEQDSTPAEIQLGPIQHVFSSGEPSAKKMVFLKERRDRGVGVQGASHG